MGYTADCYVLSNKRTKNNLINFLDYFIPNRESSTLEYEIPMYSSNPINIFNHIDDIIDYLINNKNESYAFYWKNIDSDEIKGATCFFTDDDNLILGLYCETNFPDTSAEDKIFYELKKYCNSNSGYITYEQPAPINSLEFLKISNQ